MDRRIDSIQIGDSAVMVRQVSEDDVMQMADISKDYNPIHMDEEYAKVTRFKGKIAHGLFCQSMISALLANELPGVGTIILSENIKFLYPVYIGDTVLAQVKIENIHPEKSRIELSFFCENQNKRLVAEGTVVSILENVPEQKE